MTSKKIILDLCGGTGAWSYPYRVILGRPYEVQLVTLPGHNVLTFEPPARVHGILAAPPCTYWSVARSVAHGAPTDEQLQEAIRIVDRCLEIVDSTKPEWWALENPATGWLSSYLGEPKEVFQPWQYGDPWPKLTGLWGSFTMPTPLVTEKPRLYKGRDTTPAHFYRLYRKRFKLITEPRNRAEVRAITPPGFAGAFMRANP